MKIKRILYVEDDASAFDTLGNQIAESFAVISLGSERGTDYLKYVFQNKNKRVVVELLCVKNSSNAKKWIEEQPFDLAFIDYQLANETGDKVGKELSELHLKIHTQILYQVMLTAHSTSILSALRSGVFMDFISKPIRGTEFSGVIGRFKLFKDNEEKRLEAEQKNVKLKNELSKAQLKLIDLQKDFNIDFNQYEDKQSSLKGNSNIMKGIRCFIDLYSKNDLPVLILGETGTGKELVAYELHKKSEQRSKYPFVAVNCAAIPDTLIESELFGHKKGSFTGASNDYIGKFMQANNGVLFLDEFGDLSPLAQVKVLRAIETKMITPLRGKEQGCNVRVICATSNKIKETAGNSFRIDLFYRVGGLFPEAPPLRIRKEDIPNILATLPDIKKRVSANAVNELIDCDYNWPGNVRELLNFIKHATAIFPNSKLDTEKLMKLLEIWKTHQPVEGLFNASEHKSDKKNIGQVTSHTDNSLIDYTQGSKSRIHNHLKVIVKAMRDDQGDLITNLNEIAAKRTIVNESLKFIMDKNGKPKTFSKHGNTLSTFFRDNANIINLLVQENTEELRDIIHLRPFNTFCQPDK